MYTTAGTNPNAYGLKFVYLDGREDNQVKD